MKSCMISSFHFNLNNWSQNWHGMSNNDFTVLSQSLFLVAYLLNSHAFVLKKWDFRSEWPKVRNSCILHPLIFLGFSPYHRIKPSSYYSSSNHTAEQNYMLLNHDVIILFENVRAIVMFNDLRKNSSQIC